MEDNWAGEERRSIPIHILTYVDTKLDAHTQKIEEIFQQHIETETSQISEIFKTLNKNNEESTARHSVLVDKITAYQGHVELMEQAFLETEKGTPDYEGHRHFHKVKKDSLEWWDKVKQNAVSKVVEWGTIGILVWVLGNIVTGKIT